MTDSTTPKPADERLAEWVAGAEPDPAITRTERIADAFAGAKRARTERGEG